MARKASKNLPTSAPAQRAVDNPFESMRRSMDEMIGRMFREWPSLDLSPGLTRGFEPFAMPSMDVAESDASYEVKVDLPGMDQKDIKVSLDGDTLTIAAEHVEEKETKKKTYHVSERRRGSVRRSLRLPSNVDPAKIDARFDKGVLTLELPKGQAAETSKTIRIRSA